MAGTITTFTAQSDEPTDARPAGSRRRVRVNLKGDSSYATNGSTIDPKLFGFTDLDSVQCSHNVAGTHYYVWDSVNAKLKGFVQTTGAEIANAFDASAHVIPADIVGI
jgi:hypothetical protein